MKCEKKREYFTEYKNSIVTLAVNNAPPLHIHGVDNIYYYVTKGIL